jgi:hypothetical protein
MNRHDVGATIAGANRGRALAAAGVTPVPLAGRVGRRRLWRVRGESGRGFDGGDDDARRVSRDRTGLAAGALCGAALGAALAMVLPAGAGLAATLVAALVGAVVGRVVAERAPLDDWEEPGPGTTFVGAHAPDDDTTG